MKKLLLIGLILITCLTTTHAQSPVDLPIITAENADQLTVTQTLGRGRISDAGWTADGETLVVAAATGLWLYDADDLAVEPRFLASEHGWIRSMAIHPDEPIVATGHEDGIITIWDLGTGQVIQTFDGHQMPVDVAVSGDGKVLISGSGIVGAAYPDPDNPDAISSKVILWDMETGEAIKEYTASNLDLISWPIFHVTNVAISPDKNVFMVSGIDDPFGDAGMFVAGVFNTTSDQAIPFPLNQNDDPNWLWTSQIFFSPDNHWWVTDSGYVWNRETASLVDTDIPYLIDGSFSSNGDYFVALLDEYYYRVEEKHPIAVYDTATWEMQNNFGTVNLGVGRNLHHHPFKSQILVIYPDESIQLWDVLTGTQLASLNGFTGETTSLDYSADGNWLAANSRITGINLFETNQYSVQASIASGQTHHVIFSPDSTLLAYDVYQHSYYSYPDNDWLPNILELHLWEVATQSDILVRDDTPLIEDFVTGYTSLAFSRDGSLILSYLESDFPLLWNMAQQKFIPMEDISEAMAGGAVAFSPDQKHIALPEQWYLSIYDLETLTPLKQLEAVQGSFSAIEYSHDGRWIAVSAEYSGLLVDDGHFYIVDTETDNTVLDLSLEIHQAGYNDVVFSPDNTLLAYAADDSTIHILNVGTWKEVAVMNAYQGRCTTLDFSADGTTLAAGYSSGVILLWQVAE